jgi:putative ABC transport system permease protein
MTRPNTVSPPHWIVRRLRRLLPPGSAGATILGDLHEEYRQVRPGMRNLWYLWAAIGLAIVATWKTPRPSRITAFFNRDVRLAVRSLVRQPAYAFGAILTLGLGIGATTSIASVVYGSVFKPLPFEHADRILRIGDQWGNVPPTSLSSISVANFLDLDERSRTVERFAAFTYGRSTISGAGSARSVRTLQATPGFLDFLGIAPRQGRDIGVGDSSNVVLVTDDMWRTSLGGKLSSVGDTILVDLIPHTIVGVVPAGFVLPGDPELIRPLEWSPSRRANRRQRSIEAMARAAPGIALNVAMEEMNAIFAELATAHPQENEGVRIAGMPLTDWMVQGAKNRMVIFAGAVSAVLLVACVNVAALLLARGERRRHETAVCAALGADRWALAARALAEVAVLAAAGGLFGVLLASWGVKAIVATYGDTIPRASAIQPDETMLVVGLAAALLASLLTGVLPAAQASRLTDSLRASRSSLPRRQMLHRVLVAGQVALAVVLASTAGLLVNSLWRLGSIDLGVVADRVVTFGLALPPARYTSPESMSQTFTAILDELRRVPQVASAGGTTRRPLFGGTNGTVRIPGGKTTERVELRAITPGYFESVGARIIAGRDFVESDARPGRRAVIVNEAFVRALLDGANPLGANLMLRDSDIAYEIVGVVSDIREMGPEAAAPAGAYWTAGSAGPSWTNISTMTIVVRATGNPSGVLPIVRQQLAARDPDLALEDIATLESLWSRRLGRDRHTAVSLLGSFAVVAVALGCVGIYGVVALNVQQRTREFGIRLALGATGRRLLGNVLLEGVLIAVVGTGVGLLGAAFAARLLGRMLYEVSPHDPATLAGTAAIMLTAAVFACAWPAVRAARVAPVEALRQE